MRRQQRMHRGAFTSRVSRYITRSRRPPGGREYSDAPLYIGWEYGRYIKAGLHCESEWLRERDEISATLRAS